MQRQLVPQQVVAMLGMVPDYKSLSRSNKPVPYRLEYVRRAYVRGPFVGGSSDHDAAAGGPVAVEQVEETAGDGTDCATPSTPSPEAAARGQRQQAGAGARVWGVGCCGDSRGP